MANQVKISFEGQPAAFSQLIFLVVATGGSPKYFTKTFVAGVPTGLSQVQIGSDVAGTVVNLCANMQAADSDGVLQYSRDDDGVRIGSASMLNYNYVITAKPSVVLFSLVPYLVPPALVLPELVIEDICIEIIDTYDNDRALIVEHTQAGSPRLTWDGGDDLYSQLMASKLVFDMLVDDLADAKFKHLFTGDEQRYLVKVSSVNNDDEFTLIWQGYLLPDQFKEPYKNGVYFPEFIAIDMIASLRGKYLKRWYYANRFPIAQLLGYILAETGLQQNLIVKPSIIPVKNNYVWDDLNINLAAYVRNGTVSDILTVLNDILKAQGMILYSYRGYWWLEGITRRGDTSGIAYQYAPDGSRLADVAFEKNVVEPMLAANPPMISGVTPWRSVKVELGLDASNNMFGPNVVKVADLFTDSYANDQFSMTKPSGLSTVNSFRNWDFKDWTIVGMTDNWNFRRAFVPKLEYYKWIGPSLSNVYNKPESYALVNYLQCKQRVFVRAGISYKLVLEFKATEMVCNTNPEVYKAKLAAGDYDMLFPWQMLLNGGEILSNRPSFPESSRFKYDTESSSAAYSAYVFDATFKMEHEFKVASDGLVDFRVLMPIIHMDGEELNTFGILSCESLRLEPLDAYENESVSATRPINYTQILDYPISMSSSADESIKNNIGLGKPVNSNYFNVISRSGLSTSTGFHLFAPATVLQLKIENWIVPGNVYNDLFVEGLTGSVFITKVSGYQELFDSLYCQRAGGGVLRMGYLKEFTGRPVLPKGYEAYDDLQAGDVIAYMHVRYAQENLDHRQFWKMYGSNETDTYARVLAKALHAVQPEVLYRLEAEALELLFPDQLVLFGYDGQERRYIPTRITLDLYEGRTSFVATERKITELTDIRYE